MNQKAIQAASTALAECGYDFPMPVDGDLDDEERGRYEALVAALTAAAPFMGAEWQPIETAPRTEWILVWRPGSNVRDAAWCLLPPGPGFWTEGSGGQLDPPPTDWMPLPTAPQAQVAVTAGNATTEGGT